MQKHYLKANEGTIIHDRFSNFSKGVE